MLLRASLCALVFIIGARAPQMTAETQEPGEVLARALEKLNQSPSGKALLSNAVQLWKLRVKEELKEVITPATVSKTDAVLTRHFDPHSGEETHDRQITVFIKTNQAFSDVVLDLAHELVHATRRNAWDPYDPELTAGNYIWNALEGQGGEVDAVTTECTVARELNETGARCKPYFTEFEAPAVDRERIVRDFYKSGDWFKQIQMNLKEEASRFSRLSAQSPKFYSSTGQAPYPFSLLEEYSQINQAACDNTQRRLQSIQLTVGAANRAPASLAQNPSVTSTDPVKKASHFLARRCR